MTKFNSNTLSNLFLEPPNVRSWEIVTCNAVGKISPYGPSNTHLGLLQLVMIESSGFQQAWSRQRGLELDTNLNCE